MATNLFTWNDGAGGGTALSAANLNAEQNAVLSRWVPVDALHRRVAAELREWTNWLDKFAPGGYMAEFGWPGEQYAAGDAAKWNLLAEGYYRELQRNGIWSTQWGASQAFDTYELAPYKTAGGGVGSPLASVQPQAAPLEAHAQDAGVRRGVAITGLEFGSEINGFSNSNPGTLGVNYFDEQAASYTFVAGRGVRLARVGFKWERIQPTLGGALDPTYLGLLQTQVTRARTAGMQVVLDCHNYGYYTTAPGFGNGASHPLGADPGIDGNLTVAHFQNLWTRLSTVFKNDAGVAAYGLMNEPNSLFAGPGGATAQLVWEDASQKAVDAIRANGDSTLLMIPGYNYSKVQGWATQHPQPWISDYNFLYEAHHYWDSQSSAGGLATSVYSQTYASALADAVAAGY